MHTKHNYLEHLSEDELSRLRHYKGGHGKIMSNSTGLTRKPPPVFDPGKQPVRKPPPWFDPGKEPVVY